MLIFKLSQPGRRVAVQITADSNAARELNIAWHAAGLKPALAAAA